MKTILTSVLIASIAFLFAIGGSPLVFASTVGGVSVAGAPSSSYAPALTKVSVTVSLSPKSITLGTTGCTTGYKYCGSNTVKIDNKGTTSYTFTGCVFEYKLTSASKYTKSTCSLAGSITVAGGETLSATWTTSSNTAGTYNAQVWFTNSKDMSGVGKYTFKVP